VFKKFLNFCANGKLKAVIQNSRIPQSNDTMVPYFLKIRLSPVRLQVSMKPAFCKK